MAWICISSSSWKGHKFTPVYTLVKNTHSFQAASVCCPYSASLGQRRSKNHTSIGFNTFNTNEGEARSTYRSSCFVKMDPSSLFLEWFKQLHACKQFTILNSPSGADFFQFPHFAQDHALLRIEVSSVQSLSVWSSSGKWVELEDTSREARLVRSQDLSWSSILSHASPSKADNTVVERIPAPGHRDHDQSRPP